MYEVYSALSPAVWKVLIALEELGADYAERPINPAAGDQLTPEFRAINPNAKIPALVDRAPADGGAPLAVFESGAILIYLAEKHGRLLPSDARGRSEAIQWIMWQMAGLGPIMGNARHFRHFAPAPVPYGIERFTNEAIRLCGVLNDRLNGRDFVAAEQYSMADICCWPWLLYMQSNGVDANEFPHLARWFDTIGQRPAIRRLAARAWETYDYEAAVQVDDKTRSILFGRTR